MIARIMLALWVSTALLHAQVHAPVHPPLIPSTPRELPLARPLVSMPFGYYKQHIFVTVAVNGRRGMTFLIDSGSSMSGLNLHTAETLDIKPHAVEDLMDLGLGEGRTFVAAEIKANLTIGNLNFNEKMLVVDMSGLEKVATHRIDGILGFPFLQQYVVKLDFKKNIMSLYDPDAYLYQGTGYAIPARVKNNVPVIDARLYFSKKKHFAVNVEVDTGSDDTILLYRKFEVKHHLQRLVDNVHLENAYGLGGNYTVARSTIDSVHINPLKADQIRIGFSTATHGISARSGIDGEVGNAFLHKSNRLIFDMPHDQIIFEIQPPQSTPEIDHPALVQKTEIPLPH